MSEYEDKEPYDAPEAESAGPRNLPAVVTRQDGEIVNADPIQARVDSVARVLDAAYLKASTLELSKEEREALLAPFDDDAIRPGAGGKADQLYLEHASIRERLLAVFGPGQWCLIPRRMWPEHYKTSEGNPAVRVYADCVLMVRGYYAGESIGAMSYFPNNPKQDYSDAADGAQSFALRKIAGKYLGVGLQVWHKSFCDGWKARQKDKGKRPTEYPKQAARQEVPEQQPEPPQWTEKDHLASQDELLRWEDRIQARGGLSIAMANLMAPEIANMHQLSKGPAWDMLYGYSKKVGWKWNREAKAFITPLMEEVPVSA